MSIMLYRWINCNIAIVSDNGYEWGDIYKNHTGVGVLGNIVEDRADLAISTYFYFSYSRR